MKTSLRCGVPMDHKYSLLRWLTRTFSCRILPNLTLPFSRAVPLLGRVATCFVTVSIANPSFAQYYFVTAAQCRDTQQQKNNECQALYRNTRSVCNDLPTNRYLACANPISQALDKCYAENKQLIDVCNHMRQNESNAAQEVVRRYEAQQAQALQQRQQEQQQQALSAHQRALQAYETTRQTQQATARAEASARAMAAARTRTQIAGSIFGAVLGAMASANDDDDPPPSPAYSPPDVYRAVAPMKESLQAGAMPGGSSGVAARVQDTALSMLSAAHQQIDSRLQTFKADAETISAPNPWAAGDRSTQIQPASYLPVNTGAPGPANPWANEPSANAQLADSSPVAPSPTAREINNSNGSVNPWANPLPAPITSGASAVTTAPSASTKCRPIASVVYKYQWAKGALQCYANVPRTTATNADICCE